MSKAYRQTGNSYCSACYGTTFTGGFQPTAYHLYMLAADTEEIRTNLQTGQFWRERPQVQLSWYPTIRQGDIVFRVTTWSGNEPTSIGAVYQVAAVEPRTIRTGPINSAPVPFRTNVQPGASSTIMVGQLTTLENLPPGHPYYQVAYK